MDKTSNFQTILKFYKLYFWKPSETLLAFSNAASVFLNGSNA
jgi:hypothetical protein